MTTFLRRSSLGVVWGVVWALAIPTGSPAYARTLYIRQGGSDANDGLSPARALRTIAAGVASAVAEDTVLVGPGVYREGDIQLKSFVRVRADRRGTAVGDPPGDVVVDATGFSTGFEANAKLVTTVDGFVVYGAGVGIYVKSGSHRATISNNVVCNNNSNGVYVQDARDATVFNNLVYNNGGSGILIAANVDGSPRARVLNNTVYRNTNRGIFISGVDLVSSGGLVLNNIVVASGSNEGIQVNEASRKGYVGAGNVIFENRFFSGTPIDATDMEADPLFVDPDGADGILGGSGYADDDFHLSQQRAGELETSPAVDAGSDLSRRLGLLRSSTRTDGRPDRGIVDAGYHYGNFSDAPAAPEQTIRLAKVYVTSNGGNDANDGTTRERAWRTLTHAFSQARPGNAVVIVGGAYSEGQLSFPSSGRAGRPIVVKATNGARIAGAADQIGLLFNAVSHVLVDGLHISGAGDSGIEVRNSAGQGLGTDNIVLRRVRLTDNGRRGLTVRNSAGVRLTGAVVERNGSRGIQVEGSALRVERSTVRDNGEYGVYAFDGSSVAMSDSDLVGNKRDGVLVEASDVSLYRGSIQSSGDGGIRYRSGSTGLVEETAVFDNADVGIQAVSSVVGIVGSRVRGNAIGVQSFVNPVTQLPTEVTIDRAQVCDSGGIGVDVQDTAATLTQTDLCANGKEGVRQRGGSLDIVGGQIRSNRTGGVSATDASRATIREAVVTNNLGAGFQTLRVPDVAVRDSVLHANSGDGLSILEGTKAEISNNVVDQNNSSGIVLTGNTDATISATDLRANRAEGLRQRGGSVDMFGGQVRANGSGGIAATDGLRLTVQETSVTDNTGNGIQTLRIADVASEDVTLRANTGDGLTVLDAATAEIIDNVVDGNGSTGVLLSGDVVASITGSDLLANREGLSQRGGVVDLVGGEIRFNRSGGVTATDAVRLTLQRTTVSDNQGKGVQAVAVAEVGIEDVAVHTNTLDGITILDSPGAEVINNLVYGNGGTGILISGDTVGSPGALVAFNTVYGNGNRGLLLGGSDLKPPSPNAVVTRNIFRGNATAGIQVNNTSREGYVGDFNLSTDPYSAPVGHSDILADPLFVAPEAADFHLSQRAAGQGVRSPAVDAGGMSASAAGMDDKTTRTDRVTDRDSVDLGYHYRP